MWAFVKYALTIGIGIIAAQLMGAPEKTPEIITMTCSMMILIEVLDD